jgi:hypothetical protein
MAVGLKVTFTIEINQNYDYQLTATASDPVDGMPTAIFLYKVDYIPVGVCTIGDIYRYPASRDETKPFYRSSSITLTDSDPLVISNIKADMIYSIQRLVEDYSAARDIVGTEIKTFSA